ncbi:hypothetical protein [Natronorubrum texcoconense]|uniref:Uncharacterized protein n=1 Tax=Natronorubrum texcoconense TaxID=1095776 RepID=A0A1G8ULW4_9EURY|nr:hypothetical protein [Natronorubrum texcoconense]SDJ54763.1 hypothetical protein SAMN04515672_0944 [Natronorubrum texcoconense]
MSDPLEPIRRPEYTGENRCWPCTITNGVVLAVLVAVAALRGRRRLAGAVAVVGAAAIALRGYVLPYTPRFAPRLVAALPIDPFHREVSADDGSLSDAGGEPDDATRAQPSGEEIVAGLVEAGVVEFHGDEIALDPDFRDDWRREMRTLRETDLADLTSVADRQTDPSVDAQSRRSWGRSVIVLMPETGAPVTLSRGIAIAELAAARALESRVESDAIRRAAGRPLRTVLERCPLCDEAVTISRSSCCGEVTPAGSLPSEKLVCPACDERFYTFEDPER